MYSVILLAALGSAPDIEAGLFRHRGGNCNGQQAAPERFEVTRRAPVATFFANRRQVESAGAGCNGGAGTQPVGSGCNGGGQAFGSYYVVDQAAAAPAGVGASVAGADFQVGQHVQHAANAKGLFPAGTGVIVSIAPWNSGDGFSYRVRCDATGKVLPVNFKASELTAIAGASVPAPPPKKVVQYYSSQPLYYGMSGGGCPPGMRCPSNGRASYFYN